MSLRKHLPSRRAIGLDQFMDRPDIAAPQQDHFVSRHAYPPSVADSGLLDPRVSSFGTGQCAAGSGFYLGKFSRTLATSTAKAPDTATMQSFTQSALGAVAVE